MELLLILLAGAIVGLLTGLVPGLHVNTLAAIALAMVPVVTVPAALFLVAVGTVHTIVNILPATYLGVPDEDNVLILLPAHRLLLDGLGRDAVRVSVIASLAAVVVTTAAAPLYRWLLLGPPDLLWHLEEAVPWILGGTLLVLLVQEERRGIRAVAWAALVLGATGALGILAFQLPYTPLVPVAPSPFLPLLGGLFGAAGLVHVLGKPPRVPRQAPPDTLPIPRGPVVGGIIAAAATAVLPGLTAAVATSLLPRIQRGGDPLHAVAALSAVNTAHACLALQVLLLTGRIRTGLAQVAAPALPDPAWPTGGPVAGAAWLLAVIVAAGALGAVGTLLLDRAASRHVHRLPGRALAAGALAVLAASTLVLTGAMGLLVFAVATLVGRVPLVAGVRRVHLVGCLLVPIFLRSIGLL